MFSKFALGFLAIASSVHATTLYLAGDSTMAADDGNAAIIGWGTAIPKYLSGITIVNDAVAGTSSRTYTTEGRFAKIINSVVANDIVVIEFGHNDGGGPTTDSGVCGTTGTTTTCVEGSETVYTFNKYIEDAVNSLKAKGAKVIVSSQTPDNPYSVGFSPSRFVGYAKTAASDTGVTYLDHFDLVIKEYTALGETQTNALYPLNQHTHTSPAGADIVAQTFVRGILCNTSNPLFSFVSNKNVVPSSCV